MIKGSKVKNTKNKVVIPAAVGVSHEKLKNSTTPEQYKPIDLKDDDIIHPVTDDQIITDDVFDMLDKSLENIIEKFTVKSLEEKNGKPVTVKASYLHPAYQPSFSWSGSRFNDGYMQPSGMTKEERYPKIYDSAVKLKPRAKRVLSFGCSTGEEAFALAKRFTDSTQIIGVDIDYNRVCTARKNNKKKNVFFHDGIGGLGQFDVVTALNVFFCLDKPIPKEKWKKTLEEVAGYVAPGGVLMIFKSDYDPNEVLTGLDFKPENIWSHTHNRNNKEYFCGYYCKKSKFWWQ
jgi:2-polyprenyl-3-methyl-5-hydroxy-6-metoxy-1,4-benzoquinol methylase